jgi:hypothetical protein
MRDVNKSRCVHLVFRHFFLNLVSSFHYEPVGHMIEFLPFLSDSLIFAKLKYQVLSFNLKLSFSIGIFDYIQQKGSLLIDYWFILLDITLNRAEALVIECYINAWLFLIVFVVGVVFLDNRVLNMNNTDLIFLSHSDLPDTLASLSPLIFALVIS